jgi:hypothetical protein
MGKLLIDGTVDLNQFWPDGGSDGDTAKLVANVTPGAIRYETAGGTAQPASVFDSAFVKYFRASGGRLIGGSLGRIRQIAIRILSRTAVGSR